MPPVVPMQKENSAKHQHIPTEITYEAGCKKKALLYVLHQESMSHPSYLQKSTVNLELMNPG